MAYRHCSYAFPVLPGFCEKPADCGGDKPWQQEQNPTHLPEGFFVAGLATQEQRASLKSMGTKPWRTLVAGRQVHMVSEAGSLGQTRQTSQMSFLKGNGALWTRHGHQGKRPQCQPRSCSVTRGPPTPSPASSTSLLGNHLIPCSSAPRDKTQCFLQLKNSPI